MKIRYIIIAGSGMFAVIFSLLLFVVILFSEEDGGGSISCTAG